MNRVSAFLAMVVASTSVLGACQWEERSTVHQASFSPDGQRVAYMVQRWESRKKAFALYPAPSQETRKVSHQLYTYNLQTDESTAVTAEGSGYVAEGLYYMPESGYAVFSHSSQVRSSGGENKTKILKLLRLASSQVFELGRSQDGFSSCGVFDIVPSPDGTVLAEIRRSSQSVVDNGIPDPAGFCSGGIVNVKLFDAENLAELADYEWGINKVVDYVWGDDGDFLVSTYDEAWRISPSSRISMIPPECTWPKTSSSQIAADHRYVQGSDDLSDPLKISENSSGQAFGECGL